VTTLHVEISHLLSSEKFEKQDEPRRLNCDLPSTLQAYTDLIADTIVLNVVVTQGELVLLHCAAIYSTSSLWRMSG
jgi:hypothetical protein